MSSVRSPTLIRRGVDTREQVQLLTRSSLSTEATLLTLIDSVSLGMPIYSVSIAGRRGVIMSKEDGF